MLYYKNKKGIITMKKTMRSVNRLDCFAIRSQRRECGRFACIDGLKKSAFTLAEVLITLGIIGVVAALTIPTLMSNYKKSVVETRLLKFYSSINQAIALSEIDNGPREDWDSLADMFCTDADENGECKVSKNLAWYNKYLAKYLKTTNVTTKDQTGKSTYDNVFVYFPDGSVLRNIASNGWNYCPFGLDNFWKWGRTAFAFT